MKRVGANIRKARWLLGWTQEDVAARGLSYRYFQELERGQRNRGGDANLYGYVGGDPINRIDPTGLLSLKEAQDIHLERNKYNRCPPTAPDELTCFDDGRTWEQDSWGEQKWRASDGSECVYDEDDNLIPDEGTFNYCSDPFTLCHLLSDVIPHFFFGPGLPGLGGGTYWSP
jgi:transcriptional regulator with XRE-family HTH domain